MTSAPATPALAAVLRARPTVRLGDDLDPDVRDALLPWAQAQNLTVVEHDATLAITTRPEHAAGAAWVHCPFAGVEHLAPALPDDVLLTRTTGTMPQRIAEYVVTWVLAERWQVARYVADSASATWDPSKPPTPPARNGATVVGTGAVGRAIARALAGVGHRVTGLSRSGRPDDAFDVVLPLSDAPADAHSAPALSGADVLVLALPHTAHTAGAITPESWPPSTVCT
ncbi:NAD(P)-dependent oxidoreductase [Promicromonospora soli]